ncbi:MAG: MG2 domain-containing protein, partial [Bacteroidaceae bacterium]
CSALDPSLEKMGDKDFKRLAKKMTFKKTFSLRNDAPNKHATDTIELKIPEAGIYLLKAQGADTKESYRLLYVSSLAIMQLPQPLKKVKICVTDSKNGQPLPHAEIVMRSHADNDNTYQTHLTTNDKGEAIVDSPKNYTEIFASWKDDNSMRPTSLTHSYKHYQYRQKDTRAKIFTDRAVYRPSQKVRVGGFVFNQTDDSTKAVPSATITLKLCNTNNRHIESSTVTTDSFGAFETSFTLPQECLNGNFHIYTDYGSANFKVEEYKRPRFKINLRQPKTAYHLGDTVTIEGQVTTWSGTPLGDTKVCCSVRRNTMIWLREDHYDTPLTLRDTLTTNPEGMFQLKVALAHSAPTSPKKTSYRRYCYAIEAKATDTNGETEQATLKLYVGNEKTLIDINMPETLCKEHPKQIFATQSNHMGATVGGKANVWITNQNDTILKTTIDFNRKGQFHFVSQLASGEYKIAIAAADDTTRQNVCEKTFTLFSLSDQHPVGSQPLTVWQRNSSFDTDSASIDVVVATPLKDTWLRYDLATNDKVVESKILHLSDSTLKFKYKYLDKYGDGIHAQFALLHDGRLYHRSVVLEKPIPDKSLEMK